LAKIDVVVIGTTNACNSKCIVCPLHYNYPTEFNAMSDALYKKIIDDIGNHETETIGFGLFNEPLLDYKLIERIKYCKETLPKVNITLSTNGSHLSMDRAEQLKDYVNIFLVSVHALDPELYRQMCPGVDLKSVLRNIDDLIAVINNPKRIRIATLVTKMNLQELEKIVKRFPNAIVESYRLSNRCGTLPIFNDITISHESGRCNERATADLIVDWDGKVLLCCQDFDKRLVLGDLNAETIEEVMNSPLRSSIRDSLTRRANKEIDICRDCDWETARSVREIATKSEVK
jgi:radical SAM protein with 4Fe4S-binding SPASM domain